MKPRAMFPAVILVALLVLPQLAGAVALHTFDCKNCHKPALSVTALGTFNVCLDCHGSLDWDGTTLLDGRSATLNSVMLGQDASNALGHNPFYNAAVLRETSHNWSASDNQLTAAGAAPPIRTTYPQFYSRYGSSNGRVTCSRCHNPHATETNPQMLTLGAGSTETMCIACHAPWNKNNTVVNNTFITHPVNVTYNSAQVYYNTTSPSENDGTINDDDGITLYGGKVVCGTCHQVHFADSNPATADTPDNWNHLSKGDGKLLRSYGRVNSDAAKSSILCKTCHEYSTHKGQHAALGCLDCHSGHSPGGNYNMLRTKVEDVYVPKLSVISNSATLNYATIDSLWKNSGAGYCEGCHDIPLSVEQHNVTTAGLNECKGCHNHATDSFTSACNACHGYAPSTNTAGGSTGYAVAGTGTFDYTTSGVFKDETQTPHKRHANGSGDYTFNCAECHYTVTDVNTDPHQNGDEVGGFQDVNFEGPIAVLYNAATPTYTKTGAGSCGTVYCHSNGGPRGATPTYAAAPVWAGGAGDITSAGVTNCAACHGNDSATMTARSNSAAHQKHLLKGYTCSACHDNTANSNTTVKATAIGGEHVNGIKDVLFSDSYDLNGVAAGGVIDLGTGYGDTVGTCSTVYCHSNGAPAEGTVYAIPDWDIATSGACGTCHKYNADADDIQDGTATAPLGGSHQAHVFTVGGPKLACTICHTNAGSGNDHVNGALSFVANMQTNVCNPCHGATAGQTTGNDREPIWSSPASVDCATCHVGAQAVINTRTAPAKNSFFTLGHGDPALNSSPNCLGCHTLTADHIDGVTDSNMLTGALTGDAYCKSCHAINSHYANTKTAGGTSNDGLACATCHEPHGDGMGTNTDVMLLGTIASRTVNNFTDKAARASYWEADNTGVCQICHDPAEVNYFNRTASGVTADSSHNPGSVCTQCHKHNSTPQAFAAGCTDCHGNTAAGNYWPDSTAEHGIAWPNRLGSHDIHITKIAGTGATTAQKNATCGYCHPGGGHSGDQAAAPADLMDGTTSKFKNILGAANVQTSTATQASGNVSCSNVDCHYKTATVATDWYTAGSQATCSYCHTVADSPYSAAASNLPDAHDKHMGEFADGGRNLTCESCHASAGGVNAHQNGVINFTTALAPLETTVTMSSAVTAGSITGPKYGLSSTATEFSSCATLYCHSTGQSSWASVNVNWASATVDCTSCHKGAATDTTLTGAHKAHTYNGATTIGRNLTCNECHNATASGNSTINNNAIEHVDKTRDLLVPNFGDSQLTCATVYCHSNGNYGATLVYNSPTLDWTVANSYNCTTCHGNGSDKAYPTYANTGDGTANANSHAAHMVGASATCGNCHAYTSTVGAAINGTTPTKHVNYAIDVYNTATITGGYSDITDTCSSISCHGGNDAVWGDTLGCRACHFGASDVDDFVYGGGTPVMAKLSSDEWTFSGHGKADSSQYLVTLYNGANLDAAAGAGDGCLYCHDSGIGHNAAGNYFRLRLHSADYSGATDPNQACLVCHDSNGPDGFDPDGAGAVYAKVSADEAPKIDKYHGGADHAAARDAGRFCWDCHDPHGDTDNADVLASTHRIQMIQRNAQVNPDAFGVPASLTATDIVFYNRTAGIGVGAFARDIAGAGAAAGVCNNCHTQTNQYTQITGKGTHPSTVCTDCHKHSENTTYDGAAFAGSGCNGCHGGNYNHSNDTYDGTNYWPDDATGTGNAEDYDKGRHGKHMLELAKVVYNHATLDQLLDPANGDPSAKQIDLCEYCHNTPGGANHLSGLPAQVNSMKNLWAPYAVDNAVYSSDQHGAGGNDTCSSVNCHNNKLTADDTYGWYNAGTSTCTMCHDGDLERPTSGSHYAHLVTSGSVYYSLGRIGCPDCHSDTVATAWTAKIAPSSNHIGGSMNVAGSRGLTYATNSCGTNSCHNNGKGGAPNEAYVWGTGNSLACSACHTNGSEGHVSHFLSNGVIVSAGYFSGFNCSTNMCHTNWMVGNDHFNSSVSLNPAISYSGNLTVGDGGIYGTCDTKVCHQDGRGTAVATPVWNRAPSAADDCTLCHFNSSSSATYSHDAHIGSPAATSYTTAASNNSIAGEYRFNCAKCHGNTLANHLNTAAANWASAPNVTIDASVAYNAGADTCSNNACHTNGTGGAANLTANWTTGWVGDDGDKCNNCHGNSPTSNAHDVHTVGIHATDIYSGTSGLLTTATATKAHGDATTSTTINCNICHNSVVTSSANDKSSSCSTVNCHDTGTRLKGDAAIADKRYHVDGSKQVAFAMATFKSKAQLRNDITTVAELNSSWTRTNDYKAATSFDAAKVTPGAAWNSGAKTCSTVDCHNGIQATWQAPANNCMACHTSLPQ